ncbi:MAG: S41 family peptidase [Planctomycetota bacterium]
MRVRTFFLWISPLVLASLLLSMLTLKALGSRSERTWWSDGVENRLRQLVGRDYVDDIGEEEERELFYGAMEAYLQGLDEYCTFYDPEERKAMEEGTTGKFGGIGVQIASGDDESGLLITGIRDDDPADRAGVRLGDRIVAVDGVGIGDVPGDEFIGRIRGDPGTEVSLGLLRDGERIELAMDRADIKVDSVVGVEMVDEEKKIGYLRIVSFSEKTGPDAAAALTRLLGRGAKSFILDLRMNTGGVLENGAVALVDLFLPTGPIVRTHGRSRSSRTVYQANRAGTLAPTEPLVVLVDGLSASAAEVVAGAFQDHRRGLLLGERTYGKFLVQSIHRLPEIDAAFQLTTARYYTPFGRALQRRSPHRIRGGLLPDVLVPRTTALTRDLLARFGRQHGLHMQVLDEPEDVPDPQLERAVALLRGARH